MCVRACVGVCVCAGLLFHLIATRKESGPARLRKSAAVRLADERFGARELGHHRARTRTPIAGIEAVEVDQGASRS